MLRRTGQHAGSADAAEGSTVYSPKSSVPFRQHQDTRLTYGPSSGFRRTQDDKSQNHHAELLSTVIRFFTTLFS